MSFKTIVTLLLLSCLSARGTALGLTERPPQEGGVQKKPSSLVITEVHWLLEDMLTTIQICTEKDLPGGTLKFVYRYGIGKTSTSITIDEGTLGSDKNCAIFTKKATYIIDEKPARYELIVTDTSDIIGSTSRGSTTFEITVITTLLTCDDSHITKVTWSGSEKLPATFQCIPGSPEFDQACYHEGNITGTELCFMVTDKKEQPVKVCLTRLIDNNPRQGPIRSNYFYYGPEAVSNAPPDATLSLTMSIRRLTHMSAIVREAEDPSSPEATPWAHVYDCSATDCTFPAYKRKLATYEVCLDAMDDSLATIETATTTFTDLSLYAFDGGFQKSMLLECVFANGLTDMKYTANLLNKLPKGDVNNVLDTSHIDCTGVTPTHACFGYLDADSEPGTLLYVTVSDTDDHNTIIVPFTIPVIPDLRRA